MPQFLTCILAANGRFRVRHIRHRVVDHRCLSGQPFHVFFNLLLKLAKSAALIFSRFAFRVILRLADRLADLIGKPREFFDLGLQLPPLRLQIYKPRNIDLHATPIAVLLNGLCILKNKSFIEHVLNR
jgi:hypothetical protein